MPAEPPTLTPQAPIPTRVDALRAGDEQAFAALVRDLSGVLLRMAELCVPNRAVAEEVVQHTWIAVIRGWTGSRAGPRSRPGSFSSSRIAP